MSDRVPKTLFKDQSQNLSTIGFRDTSTNCISIKRERDIYIERERVYVCLHGSLIN